MGQGKFPHQHEGHVATLSTNEHREGRAHQRFHQAVLEGKSKEERPREEEAAQLVAMGLTTVWKGAVLTLVGCMPKYKYLNPPPMYFTFVISKMYFFIFVKVILGRHFWILGRFPF